jgi:flagellar basal body-associated protein FliL
MGFLEEREKRKKEKRIYRIKIFILLLIILAIVSSLYISITGKGIHYSKQKAYGDWSTFKDKKKVGD